MLNLIEFDEGGIAIVCDHWLTPRKKKVLWPPVKDQRIYDKLVKERAEPNEEWKIFKITRHFYETGM